MGPPCTICTHPQRAEIDKELVQNTVRDVDGELIRTVNISALARKYGVSKDALARHRDRHLALRVSSGVARRLQNLGVKLADEILQRREEILQDIKEAGEQDHMHVKAKMYSLYLSYSEYLAKLANTEVLQSKQDAKTEETVEDRLQYSLKGLTDFERKVYEQFQVKLLMGPEARNMRIKGLNYPDIEEAQVVSVEVRDPVPAPVVIQPKRKRTR